MLVYNTGPFVRVLSRCAVVLRRPELGAEVPPPRCSTIQPAAEMLKDDRLSALLEMYLTSVLKEYGLNMSTLFSATSDAGSDVKRLCQVLLPWLWGWCLCHMINCALVEVRLYL